MLSQNSKPSKITSFLDKYFINDEPTHPEMIKFLSTVLGPLGLLAFCLGSFFSPNWKLTFCLGIFHILLNIVISKLSERKNRYFEFGLGLVRLALNCMMLYFICNTFDVENDFQRGIMLFFFLPEFIGHALIFVKLPSYLMSVIITL